ncbi:MAG TPA: hypothetical protein DIU15_07290, partial [Deltaproteobacteria bacterium]|nr:hypothetical protein [Deltaproteobacteria bacterium]
TSSGARWDNFEVRDSSGTVVAADDFSSPSDWALASGGFGDVTISDGYASSTSDWAHTNYVGQSFTVTDSIHFSLDGYWASGTNQIGFGFQSEPGVTSSSDGARGVIYLTVRFSHQRYNTGTGPSALIISYLDDSGASQQELDANVPIPASGSGWSSLEMGFYACNQD